MQKLYVLEKGAKIISFVKGGGPRWRSQGRIKSLAKLSACFIPQTPYPLFLSPAPSHINETFFLKMYSEGKVWAWWVWLWSCCLPKYKYLFLLCSMFCLFNLVWIGLVWFGLVAQNVWRSRGLPLTPIHAPLFCNQSFWGKEWFMGEGWANSPQKFQRCTKALPIIGQNKLFLYVQ